MNVPTQITDNFDLATKSFVDTNDRVLDTVVSVNERLVDTFVEVSDRTPSFEMPFAGQLPTPAEAGKQYIDFVQRAASMNRDITARVVGQFPTGTATAAKANATKAAKPAAEKASART